MNNRSNVSVDHTLRGTLAGWVLLVACATAQAQSPTGPPPVAPVIYSEPPLAPVAPPAPGGVPQPGYPPVAPAAFSPLPQPRPVPQQLLLPAYQPAAQTLPVYEPASPPQAVSPAAPLALPVYQPATPGMNPPMGMPPTTGTPGQPMTLPPAASPPADAPKFDISWNNGVFFQTANKNFSFHAGATVHYDGAWYQASPILELAPGGTGKFSDGANLRRARFFMEGTFYQEVDYKLELEFMNGLGFSPAGTTGAVQFNSVTNSPGPTDAWITIKDVPVLGNVRIGSQKEWFSLEHLNSYRYLEFMERSYLFDFSQPTAFNNGFTPGISAFRTWANDRVFSAAGMYKNDSDLLGFGFGDGQYAVTGRLAALPIWMPDEQVFWHVGGAMSHRDPVNGQVQIRIRESIRNAPFPLLNLIANTGLINAGSQDLYNLETAAVWGPLTFQAEYTANVINGAVPVAGQPGETLFFQGCYVEGLCFLTGESRTWNTKNFFFNRVTPRHPLRLKPTDCDGYGFGAWEVGVRYTYLDLSNRGVQAGRLDNVTVGLNWYLNANAKLQFNYDWLHRGDTNNPAQGNVHAFGTRCAFDF